MLLSIYVTKYPYNNEKYHKSKDFSREGFIVPRPTTKSELIEAANGQFENMWALINSMTDNEQNAAFIFPEGFDKREAHWQRDKNLRDVLVHLYEWHCLLISWVESNKAETEAPFLPEPYNWKTYGVMNVEMIWKKHQDTAFEDSKEMLKKSHLRVLELAESFSTEELFTKKVFPYTGGTTLGSYFISVTSSHYDWAMKKIKMQIKLLKESK